MAPNGVTGLRVAYSRVRRDSTWPALRSEDAGRPPRIRLAAVARGCRILTIEWDEVLAKHRCDGGRSRRARDPDRLPVDRSRDHVLHRRRDRHDVLGRSLHELALHALRSPAAGSKGGEHGELSEQFLTLTRVRPRRLSCIEQRRRSFTTTLRVRTTPQY